MKFLTTDYKKKMACKENDEFFGQNFLFLKK
jgi:hypothetical protein